MLFNSFAFLGSFAVLATGYYALPHERRWLLLLTASWGFYAAFNPAHVLLLIGVTLIAYLAGLRIAASQDERAKKAWLAVGIVCVLTTLVLFKYYAFIAESLDLLLRRFGLDGATAPFPRLDLVASAGLSFYTLSCVSYLADVHADRLVAERHFGHFALYVSFFPKLLAGPLERAGAFLPQLRRPVLFRSAGVTTGLQLMLWGLFKKVVIADRLAPFVDAAYRRPEFSSTADLVLATYFFAFQLYCDFSGYSDIAIGAAKVLGFDLMENFRRPYFSTSVQEFWGARWHRSLASWFRDYLYIPLGGGRVPSIRRYANVMVVFLLSGLWHGANWTFAVWGGLNGLYQIAQLIVTGGVRRPSDDAAGERPRSVWTSIGALLLGLLTFHQILITWVFFRASTVSDAVTILSRVARSAASLPRLLGARVATTEIVVCLALIGALLIVEALDETRPMWERLRVRPVVVRWTVYYALLIGLIVLGKWNLQQFVYMQF